MYGTIVGDDRSDAVKNVAAKVEQLIGELERANRPGYMTENLRRALNEFEHGLCESVTVIDLIYRYGPHEGQPTVL